jgi:cytochrome c biogenesis protein CcmG/thiol:disulfide interchange protein DsbE
MRRLSAFLLVVFLGACSSSTTNERQWPSVSVADATGSIVLTASFIPEDVLVVSLWSTWCVPCRRELPQLQQYALEHPEVSVVAINLGDKPESVSQFAKEIGLNMPILIDSEGRISSSLGVTSVPATLIIDSKGVVIATHLGEISSTDLATLVETSN